LKRKERLSGINRDIIVIIDNIDINDSGFSFNFCSTAQEKDMKVADPCRSCQIEQLVSCLEDFSHCKRKVNETVSCRPHKLCISHIYHKDRDSIFW